MLARCIEYANGTKHPDDAGAVIESIAEKLKAAGMTDVRTLLALICCWWVTVDGTVMYRFFFYRRTVYSATATSNRESA